MSGDDAAPGEFRYQQQVLSDYPPVVNDDAEPSIVLSPDYTPELEGLEQIQPRPANCRGIDPRDAARLRNELIQGASQVKAAVQSHGAGCEPDVLEDVLQQAELKATLTTELLHSNTFRARLDEEDQYRRRGAASYLLDGFEEPGKLEGVLLLDGEEEIAQLALERVEFTPPTPGVVPAFMANPRLGADRIMGAGIAVITNHRLLLVSVVQEAVNKLTTYHPSESTIKEAKRKIILRGGLNEPSKLDKLKTEKDKLPISYINEDDPRRKHGSVFDLLETNSYGVVRRVKQACGYQSLYLEQLHGVSFGALEEGGALTRVADESRTRWNPYLSAFICFILTLVGGILSIVSQAIGWFVALGLLGLVSVLLWWSIETWWNIMKWKRTSYPAVAFLSDRRIAVAANLPPWEKPTNVVLVADRSARLSSLIQWVNALEIVLEPLTVTRMENFAVFPTVNYD